MATLPLRSTCPSTDPLLQRYAPTELANKRVPHINDQPGVISVANRHVRGQGTVIERIACPTID